MRVGRTHELEARRGRQASTGRSRACSAAPAAHHSRHGMAQRGTACTAPRARLDQQVVHAQVRLPQRRLHVVGAVPLCGDELLGLRWRRSDRRVAAAAARGLGCCQASAAAEACRCAAAGSEGGGKSSSESAAGGGPEAASAAAATAHQVVCHKPRDFGAAMAIQHRKQRGLAAAVVQVQHRRVRVLLRVQRAGGGGRRQQSGLWLWRRQLGMMDDSAGIQAGKRAAVGELSCPCRGWCNTRLIACHSQWRHGAVPPQQQGGMLREAMSGARQPPGPAPPRLPLPELRAHAPCLCASPAWLRCQT